VRTFPPSDNPLLTNFERGEDTVSTAAAATTAPPATAAQPQRFGRARVRPRIRTRVVAVVCTCDRGERITATLESILANRHPDFSVLVVDQSTENATARALQPYLDADSRLFYTRAPRRGLGCARNVGLMLAGSGAEVVAFTDDDCTVPPHWLETLDRVFAERPRVAVAYCSVLAAPHDPTTGFVPAYERAGSRLVTGLREKFTARAIGAGIAVRRNAVLSFGGFDEFLGAGAHFPSAEDFDMTVRALLHGWHVFETDVASVVHHGYRAHTQGRDLALRDWVGMGAAAAKPLRAGHWGFLGIASYEFFVKAVWPPVADLLCLRAPRGAARITGFLRGFREAWQPRWGVDPDTLCFVKKDAEEARPS
jgi:Predicted glycosyltransferases